MPPHIGRFALMHVTPRGFNAIVIALLRCRAELGRWWWRCINHRLRMRTSGQRERHQQNCQQHQLLHD
jgi:hypothetical protein